MKVLVVEDHPDLLQALTMELQDDGYGVDSSCDGNDALKKMMDQEYDAIILDVFLPGIDGIHLLKHLRDAKKSTPVIMLTSKTDTNTKVASLNIGADDYLTKPFEYIELSARLRALLRRSRGDNQKVITIGNVTINPETQQVFNSGNLVNITQQEYAILSTLCSRRGRVTSRELLYSQLSDNVDTINANLMDVVISKLRKKLGKEIILTKRGFGYFIEKE